MASRPRFVPPQQLRPQPHTRCAECHVRALALFKGVPEEHLEPTQRFRSAQYVVAPQGHIYLEGEPNPNYYTLYDGWVMLYKTIDNGKRQILRFSLPGDFLGFQRDVNGPMTHSAMAMTPVTLCCFPKETAPDMFVASPNLATRLASINARHYELCELHLLSTGRKSAIERVAFLLLELFHRAEVLGFTEGEALQLPLAQEDIADATGLTPVHVNRMLRQLREKGMIDYRDRRLVILNEPAMAELAHFEPSFVEEAALL
jgi:CRP/FNR family transcriptional regulator